MEVEMEEVETKKKDSKETENARREGEGMNELGV